MMFMNEWDIHQAMQRYSDHSVLGPAAQLLMRFVDLVNDNSDGWAYWPKAPRAAKKLMQLLQSGDGTEADLKKATTPLKAFCTRHKLEYPSDQT
jgi:hypothetical protein